jgi:type I restriction enzyme, R subunit
VTRIEADNIDPNEMYRLYDEIMAYMLINKDDVEDFAEAYYKNDTKQEIIAAGDNALSHTVDRIKELSKEEKLEFRAKIKGYINLYNLILQVHPIKDIDLHKLNIYLRFLLKRIDLETPGNVDISDKVVLEYFQLENRGEQDIPLIREDTELPPVIINNILPLTVAIFFTIWTIFRFLKMKSKGI